jgi:hypothetical protein
MPGRPTLAALILAAAASSALAGEATLGDVSVSLPPPAGFCELDASAPFESRVVALTSKVLEQLGNRLLAVSTDCGQLADARAGRRRQLDDVVQYQTQIAAMNMPAARSVAQVCEILRARGSTILPNEMTEIKARFASTLEKIRVNETSDLGVLAEDANACYAALVQKLRTEAGTDKMVVGECAVIIIKNRTVNVCRFAVYQNPDTVDAVLAKLKVDAAAAIAANP